jgi:DNA-binding transcriptional ArsR family regulator
MNVLVFAALAEPKRLRIVEILREGPASVGELAAQLTLGQPQTSKHLKTLSDAHLVEVRPVAQRRIYHLRPEPFRAIDTWLDSYRPTWDERIDAMERYLGTLTGSSSNPPRK